MKRFSHSYKFEKNAVSVDGISSSSINPRNNGEDVNWKNIIITFEAKIRSDES